MTNQNYLIVESNVVTNIVVWDGGTDWTPPQGSIQLVQATTPAMIWEFDSTAKTWGLVSVVGAGNIGFTWDGTTLKTGQAQPTATPATNQPTTTGTKTV